MNPEQTSVQILRGSKTVYQTKPAQFTKPNSLYEKSLCLALGINYTLRVKDSAGDGLLNIPEQSRGIVAVSERINKTLVNAYSIVFGNFTNQVDKFFQPGGPLYDEDGQLGLLHYGLELAREKMPQLLKKKPRVLRVSANRGTFFEYSLGEIKEHGKLVGFRPSIFGDFVGTNKTSSYIDMRNDNDGASLSMANFDDDGEVAKVIEGFVKMSASNFLSVLQHSNKESCMYQKKFDVQVKVSAINNTFDCRSIGK